MHLANEPYQLGGSWVAISGVISRVTIPITLFRGLITLLITTREPPRRALPQRGLHMATPHKERPA